MTGQRGSNGRMSRRDFLRRSAGAAVALPGMSAILAACAKPGTTGTGDQAGFQLARPDNPVTLPLNGMEPIPTDTPIEKGATLQVYNWIDYMWKKVLAEFEDLYDVKIEWTTYNTMVEGIQKLSSGQIQADVFFPTVDFLGKLVASELLQPLNHDLIPNLADNYWKQYQNPFYDQGWRYTVPYTIYTTGIGYRRDFVSDQEVAEKQYDILWDSTYRGKVGIYDDYREVLGMALLKRGYDVNSGNAGEITQAKDDILALIDATNARLTINGTYDGIPNGRFWVHQSWSGDMIGAQWYRPKGVSNDVLGFWYPPEGGGLVGNDLITIPSSSQNPRLAHEFLNFFLSRKYGVQNFSWNGYQPPMTSLRPDRLVQQKYVPPTVETAVVRASDFDTGHFLLELSPEVDTLWLDAWDEIKAGA